MCWLALAGRRLGFLLCQLVHRIQVILIGWGQNKAWLSSHRETERGRKGKQQLGSALCSPCVHNQAWVLVHCPWISMSAGSVWLGALSTDHCDCTVTRLATHLSASCHDLVWHVQVVCQAVLYFCQRTLQHELSNEPTCHSMKEHTHHIDSFLFMKCVFFFVFYQL